MVNPERLWASASQLYGEANMLAMWGEFVPVPEERMHVLAGGETLTIAGDTFEVAYTPGHAKHHVSYLHRGTAFVGDVGGVRIEPGTPTLPPTPPPDIDIEAWHNSIGVIRDWKPERLAITHFGLGEEPAAQLDELELRLDHWADSARAEDRDGWIAAVTDELRSVVSPGAFDSFLAAVPLDQAYAGLRRYWDKRSTPI
jgi:glyoxylase-like metal-dependent hydrolase (beta-lactamase superfamily II)